MNLNNKKVRRIVAIIIFVLIAAMVVGPLLAYLV